MNQRATICNNTQIIIQLVSETIDLLTETPKSEWRTDTMQALRSTFTQAAYTLGDHPYATRWKNLVLIFEHRGLILLLRRAGARAWALPHTFTRVGDVYEDAASLSLRMVGLPVDADDFAFAYERPASVCAVYQINPDADMPPVYLECADYGEYAWVPFETIIAPVNPAGVTPDAIGALMRVRLIDGALVLIPLAPSRHTDDAIPIDPLAHI